MEYVRGLLLVEPENRQLLELQKLIISKFGKPEIVSISLGSMSEAELKNQMKIKDFTINLGEKLTLSDKAMKVATEAKKKEESSSDDSSDDEPKGMLRFRQIV